MRASSAWKPSSRQRRSTSVRCEGARAITAPPPPAPVSLAPIAPAARAPCTSRSSASVDSRRPRQDPVGQVEQPPEPVDVPDRQRLQPGPAQLAQLVDQPPGRRQPPAQVPDRFHQIAGQPRLPRQPQAQLHRLAHGRRPPALALARTRRCRRGERRPRPRPTAVPWNTSSLAATAASWSAASAPVRAPTARATATAIAAELPRPPRAGDLGLQVDVQRGRHRRPAVAINRPSAWPTGEAIAQRARPAASRAPAPARGRGERARAPPGAGRRRWPGGRTPPRARPAGSPWRGRTRRSRCWLLARAAVMAAAAPASRAARR